MEKKSKKSIIIGITLLLLVTLTLLGLTYAYYRTRIIGNEANTSVSVASKYLEITYEDGASSINLGEKIEPGSTINKEFVVKNSGDDVGYYSIHLENVVNTFINYKDLTYVLKRNGEVVKSGTFPSIDKPIMFKESLNAPLDGVCNEDNGCLSNYELIITYENANYDQSEDMGKTLECLIQIYAEINTIKIEDASDLQALSRALTYTETKGTNYDIDTDLNTLGLNLSDKTNEEKIEYLSTANYELTNDVSVNFNRTFGNSFFLGIGNTENVFTGNFFGNDHTITLGASTAIGFSSQMNTFGLFSSTKNNVITDLNVALSKDIVSNYNVSTIYYGLLSGLSNGSTFENIEFNLNHDFKFNQTNSSTYRQSVFMGLVAGRIINDSIIQNITFNLENSDVELSNLVSSDTNVLSLGLVAAIIEQTNRTTINNVKVNLTSSNVNLVATVSGIVGGLVGTASKVDFNNIKVDFNNSSIKVSSEKTGNVNAYNSLAAGGVVGFCAEGSDNTAGTVGNVGVVLNSVRFMSKNDSNIEVVSAKEKLGGGVNAGGLVGISFNNAQISNSIVDINSGTIIAERSEENSVIAGYGAHSGGIIGRMEHTGRIDNCEVIGDSLNIIANSTEQNIYSGGIAGIVLNPIHKDLIPLDSNKVIGNGTTNITANLITGSNTNNFIAVGGLTGFAGYIIKDNSVSGLNVNINGLNENTKNAYLSNYIGKYNDSISSEYFTPKTSEIINPIINNVSVNTNGLDSYVTLTNY